jgi:hypothetical protein
MEAPGYDRARGRPAERPLGRGGMGSGQLTDLAGLIMPTPAVRFSAQGVSVLATRKP